MLTGSAGPTWYSRGAICGARVLAELDQKYETGGNYLFYMATPPQLFLPIVQHLSSEITVSESLGVEGRGGYYDKTGALRDMVPNHLVQLLALTAMEAPSSFTASSFRGEQAKVLEAIPPISPDACSGVSCAGNTLREPSPARVSRGPTPRPRCFSGMDAAGSKPDRFYNLRAIFRHCTLLICQSRSSSSS
jgi:hypothetical protein